MDPLTSIPNTDPNSRLMELLSRKAPESAALLQQLYRDGLTRFCLGYLGRPEEAEDAVQDIFLKVIQSGTVPPHFRGWLYKIARNHCLKLLRDKSARGGSIHQPSQIPELLTGQLTRMVNDEVQVRLDEVFAALSSEQQEVLQLRYAQDLSRIEIAQILDVPESVVKSRLFEGIKKLRDEAERLGHR